MSDQTSQLPAPPALQMNQLMLSSVSGGAGKEDGLNQDIALVEQIPCSAG